MSVHPPLDDVETRVLVSDLMTRELLTLAPFETMLDAARLMNEAGVRHLPVTDDQRRLRGLVTQRDVLRVQMSEACGQAKIREHLAGIRVEDAMTREVATVAPDLPLTDAAEILLRYKHGCLPVLEGGRVVGIVTEYDFLGMAYRMMKMFQREQMGG